MGDYKLDFCMGCKAETTGETRPDVPILLALAAVERFSLEKILETLCARHTRLLGGHRAMIPIHEIKTHETIGSEQHGR